LRPDYDTTVTDIVKFLLLVLPEAVKAAALPRLPARNLAWRRSRGKRRGHARRPTPNAPAVYQKINTPPPPRKKAKFLPVRL